MTLERAMAEKEQTCPTCGSAGPRKKVLLGRGVMYSPSALALAAWKGIGMSKAIVACPSHGPVGMREYGRDRRRRQTH